jgi:hypothetical protein
MLTRPSIDFLSEIGRQPNGGNRVLTCSGPAAPFHVYGNWLIHYLRLRKKQAEGKR